MRVPLPGPDTTLIRLLADNASQAPGRVAIREKDLGIWQEYTWQDYLDHVLCLAAGLEELGFRPGDALMIVGDNRPQLYFGTLAAAALRGYPTPVYPDAVPSEILHIARQSGARYALAEDQEQVDKLLALREHLPQLQHILYDDPRGLRAYREPGLLAYETVREAGRKRIANDPSLRTALIHRAQPDDPAVLLHSSGTTGAPKGIPLTHRKFLAIVPAAVEAGVFSPGEEAMAYLPMAWVGDFAFSVAAGVALRWVLNVPERQETLVHDLREAGPTLFFAPPRIWDQLRTRIEVMMADAPLLKRWLYRSFVRVGAVVERDRLDGRRSPWWYRALAALGRVVLYGPLLDQMGLSRVRNAYTGGEALGEDTIVFFRGIGVNLKQLYGQTEGCALYCVHRNGQVKLHTVGPPLPGIEVRISDAGEILVRSPALFDGYFQNPAATAASLADGWFRTGDAGYLDKDGHLVVLGRVQEVAWTANGERFVPNYIENRLKFSPYIKDAAVVGEGRPFLVAMVCIDFDAVGHWAELHGIPYTSYADLSQNAEVYALVREEIQRVNRVLPEGLRIRRFVNLHKEFDPDDGEITRTRKLRRGVVHDRYKAVIAALYDGSAAVEVDAVVQYETGAVSTVRRTLAVWEAG